MYRRLFAVIRSTCCLCRMKKLPSHQVKSWVTLLVLVFAVLNRAAADDTPRAALSPKVDFNRDVRPILSDKCFKCHGPDGASRQAALRLDTEAGIKVDLGGRAALVPSNLQKSELYLRIVSEDPAERMPPAKSGKSLTPQEIGLIRTWIEQGAEWQKHWSLIPPVQSTPPAVTAKHWVRNPVDAFVLARLEREGLEPSREADRTTLIRRVSFDLTGLPPTPREVEAFLADASPDAFERVVDRLLASVRYGERMAVRWLDGARYADTSGYQNDGERFMWRWRDWVIDAYNHNLPFDLFTIEQLAGDLLPDATLEQKIATGFNRNHRGNSEGGIVPEEFAVEYVVDRVETTFAVWMGLTMGCSRCHDHKFDSLTQREFYQTYAYFNSIPEYGRAIKYGNSPPFIAAPKPDQIKLLDNLQIRLAEARAREVALEPELEASQQRWEQSADRRHLSEGSLTRGQVFHAALDGADATVKDTLGDRFENGSPAYAPGRLRQAAEFDGSRFINAGAVAAFEYLDRFTLSAWIYPRGNKGGTILSRMTDAEEATGYCLTFEGGKLKFNLVKRWLDDALRVETERTLSPEKWHHVLVTYDGSRLASGVTFYVDGRPEPKRILLDLLNQTFASTDPLRIGGGNGPNGRFHGLIDDVRIYSRTLSGDEAQIVAAPETIAEILSIPRDRLTRAQSVKLRAYYLENHAPQVLREARERVLNTQKELDALLESVPTTMVMQEMPVPRDAHILTRGEYQKPGDKVSRDVPASLPPLPRDLPNNRLGFARWLASPQHPLTSRVAVNRLWQMLFGTGLVKTVDDFGAQGEWPSHPELLDWLAVEFSSPLLGKGEARRTSLEALVRPSWDIKRLLRLLVTSATYRQSARGTPELLQRDPENRLLARGCRMRLSAEMVRDQALHAAGLLVEKVGGPSVKPYQPTDLWKELGDMEYVQDHGEKLYRRGMYTFWKRTVPPPMMITFDSAGRETCNLRETRTNTPLQALTLMNDVTFVEASRALAQRVLGHEGGPALADQLTLAFRLVLSRAPKPAELKVLMAGWQEHRDRFRADPAAATKLLTQGEFPCDPSLDAAELAAHTTVVGVILNMDETLTKE